MKQFLSVADADSVQSLIDLALRHKAEPRAYRALGRGRTLVNYFFNPSLRTRLSTEKAGRNLGLDVITMESGAAWTLELEDGRVMDGQAAEHIREAAAVLSQYADILGVRSFPHFEDRRQDYGDTVINAFRRYGSVPLLSLESATRHPLQSLADCMTIQQNRKQPRPRVVLSWVPHPRRLPQAVANSFAEWMTAWGEVELVITNPPGFDLAPEFRAGATLVHDQDEALRGAHFVYTKNWSSYEDYGTIGDYPDWQITTEKMALTDGGHFMHCLPVRRNVVVADGVLDSDRSLVVEQVDNRVWAAQAVLHRMLDALHTQD